MQCDSARYSQDGVISIGNDRFFPAKNEKPEQNQVLGPFNRVRVSAEYQDDRRDICATRGHDLYKHEGTVTEFVGSESFQATKRSNLS